MSLRRIIVAVVIALILLGNLAVSVWTYHTITNFTVNCYFVQYPAGTGYIFKETCQDNPMIQP